MHNHTWGIHHLINLKWTSSPSPLYKGLLHLCEWTPHSIMLYEWIICLQSQDIRLSHTPYGTGCLIKDWGNHIKNHPSWKGHLIVSYLQVAFVWGSRVDWLTFGRGYAKGSLNDITTNFLPKSQWNFWSRHIRAHNSCKTAAFKVTKSQKIQWLVPK